MSLAGFNHEVSPVCCFGGHILVGDTGGDEVEGRGVGTGGEVVFEAMVGGRGAGSSVESHIEKMYTSYKIFIWSNK